MEGKSVVDEMGSRDSHRVPASWPLARGRGYMASGLSGRSSGSKVA